MLLNIVWSDFSLPISHELFPPSLSSFSFAHLPLIIKSFVPVCLVSLNGYYFFLRVNVYNAFICIRTIGVGVVTQVPFIRKTTQAEHEF